MSKAHYKQSNRNCKFLELGLTGENWHELQQQLVCEGWKSPNTYGGEFGEVPCAAGVYIFTITDTSDWSPAKWDGLVAYVGMSKTLSKRISSHPTKRKIDKLDFYLKVWFQPACADQIRNLERVLIRRFNPPWNLIGKKIGVEVS